MARDYYRYGREGRFGDSDRDDFSRGDEGRSWFEDEDAGWRRRPSFRDWRSGDDFGSFEGRGGPSRRGQRSFGDDWDDRTSAWDDRFGGGRDRNRFGGSSGPNRFGGRNRGRFDHGFRGGADWEDRPGRFGREGDYGGSLGASRGWERSGHSYQREGLGSGYGSGRVFGGEYGGGRSFGDEDWEGRFGGGPGGSFSSEMNREGGFGGYSPGHGGGQEGGRSFDRDEWGHGSDCPGGGSTQYFGRDYGGNAGGRSGGSGWGGAYGDNMGAGIGGGLSRGRTGRFSGRGPKGYRRADERIREDICEILTHHGDLDASDVDIRVNDGEVTLEGTVESRHSKRLAEDLAEQVSGVQDVRNNLRVATVQDDRWSPAKQPGSTDQQGTSEGSAGNRQRAGTSTG